MNPVPVRAAPSGAPSPRPRPARRAALRRLALCAALPLALPGVRSAAAAAGSAAGASASAPSSASAPARFAFRGYTAPVPAGWEPVPPGSGFRAAQYRVPPAPGAEPGEVVVYYFGPGQGGPVDANIARWTSQFSAADGRPVVPQVQRLAAAGLPATLVRLDGRYARGIGAGSGAPRPGQTLLAAIVETPEGNLTFQLHGDTATVERHRDGFLALLRGFSAPR